MSYASVLKRHPRPLMFGFSCGAVSNFGQTFFIALFVPSVTASFALDRTTFSSLYGAATIGSALLMPFIGRGIDRFSLSRFAAGAQLALVAGLATVALAPSVAVFALGLLLVRFCGQGLMKHISGTSTSRFFERSRGKALALVGLGHPMGEGLLPLLTTWAIASIGWRSSLLAGAGMVLVVLVIGQLLLWPLDTAPAHYRASDDALDLMQTERQHAAVHWTRGQLFSHPGFWMLLPYWVAPAFILTGLFFHQVALAQTMGFSPELWAGSFTVYAVMASGVSMFAGPLIDRVGPRRLLPLMLVPLTGAVLVLFVAQGTWVAPVHLGLCGSCIGMAGVRSAWLAERFGVEHLGSIRSGLMSIAVFATAASPPIFGVLLDAGVSFEAILKGTLAGLVCIHALTQAALWVLDRAVGGPLANAGTR